MGKGTTEIRAFSVRIRGYKISVYLLTGDCEDLRTLKFRLLPFDFRATVLCITPQAFFFFFFLVFIYFGCAGS